MPSGCAGIGAHAGRQRGRGFSLIELVIVLSITLLLTGLLLPALSGLREHTHRVISASNMRQGGMGIAMYSTDNMGRLPYSALIRAERPLMQEMMVLHLGRDWAFWDDLNYMRDFPLGTDHWEGIGLLYRMDYINAPEVFYCPSHRGDHPYERYRYDFLEGQGTIYSNYHYRGDIDETGRYYSLATDGDLVFLIDGLRTQRDFNHRIGYNLLFGNGTVEWRSDPNGELFNRLPTQTLGAGSKEVYDEIWNIIDD
jgi:prepilin-type N-terminal cleavage/methylation domain-containing protein